MLPSCCAEKRRARVKWKWSENYRFFSASLGQFVTWSFNSSLFTAINWNNPIYFEIFRYASICFCFSLLLLIWLLFFLRFSTFKWQFSVICAIVFQLFRDTDHRFVLMLHRSASCTFYTHSHQPTLTHTPTQIDGKTAVCTFFPLPSFKKL